MNRTARFLLTGTFAVLAGLTPAAAQAADAVKLIQDVQDKINVEALDLTSTFTLVQKKEGEADRVLRIRIFRRDRAAQFTLLFQYPDSEKGKGYYRNGDDLYLYRPSTREFVHRNRKDDVGSTDVRTDLFGKQDLLAQYDPKVTGTAKIAQYETTVVEMTAKTLDVSYPVQKWYLRAGDNLPVKVENYSASKTLLRTTYYVDFKQVAPGKYLFTKLMAVDNLAKNQKTLLSNEDISAAKIPDYTFSQAFLEEQSR
jgi:outer membrane lipoprotein-sorting protein